MKEWLVTAIIAEIIIVVFVLAISYSLRNNAPQSSIDIPKSNSTPVSSTPKHFYPPDTFP